MANIGKFEILRKDGYIKLEDTIKETVANFTFVKDKTYLIGFERPCRFCIKSQEPDEEEGFFIDSKTPVNYTQGDDPLWVLPVAKNAFINISE